MKEDSRSKLITEALSNAFMWGRLILGLSFYDWQAKILLSASRTGKRRKLAVRAPNGAGKDDRIIAPLALWWIRRFPKGRVVVTSKDAHQLKDQTWASVAKYKNQYSDCKWVDSEYRITTPQGGVLSCFTTDEATRAEGYHTHEAEAFEGPLLLIINEAKSVPNEIFDAFDRCTYSVLLEISTGGLKEGRFWEHFTEKSENYEKHIISLLECPHIPTEKVEQTIKEYGEHDPHTRSTLYGEFMEGSDEIRHVFGEEEIRTNQESHIESLVGVVTCGVDFAAGGDQNALVHRCGNFVPSGGIIAWRERDTMSAVGRFIVYFHERKILDCEVWADSGGGGHQMCDALAQAGHQINRVNFDAKSPDPRYLNWGTYIWYETARKVRMREIKVPKHDLLVQELLSRRTKYHSSGKVWIENKKDMIARGSKSPNIGDAFCIAFGVQPLQSASWMRGDDSRYAEISKIHGWDYTDDSPIDSDGRPGRGDSSSVFGWLDSH